MYIFMYVCQQYEHALYIIYTAWKDVYMDQYIPEYTTEFWMNLGVLLTRYMGNTMGLYIAEIIPIRMCY